MRFLAFALIVFAFLSVVPASLAHEGHVHETHDVAAAGAPRIDGFTIAPAEGGGFTVTLTVENFTFVEEDATELPAGHVGHVHLYINGSDLGMFYAATFRLEELPFGPLDFKAVLSTPEHADYAIAGRPIAATTTITVE